MAPPPEHSFHSLDDLKLFVHKWSSSHGYKLTVVNSKTNKNVYFGCSLRGKDRSVDKDLRKRDSRSKSIGCPFRISGHISCAQAATSRVWHLRSASIPHNHSVINPNFEVIHQKLSSLGQKEVARLSLFGMEPRSIAIQLSNSEGRLVSSRTIYNCKAGQLREKMQGMEPMQYLIHAVNSSNWVHHYEHNPEGELLYLFFAHPAAIQLARRFHHIAVIDATYKTNLCNYPLLHVVGQTATNQSFSIAFCFMRSESDSAYLWAIQQLR
jgi:hypothetical protein